MATSNLKYSNTEALGQRLGIISEVPSWDVGGEPTKEEVGTGDGTEKIFYLDHRFIVNNSQTLYYGSASTTTTQLTETTHYTIDLDTGKITLTSDGATLVSTNKVYAEYSYFNNDMKDSYLEEVLLKAEAEVDGKINSSFTDSTATNPDYPVETEIQPSPGYFLDQMISSKKPLIDIATTLDGDLAIDATTIPLASGTGATYPSSGYVIIGSEVILYSGITDDNLTGATRGALSTTASTHSDGDSVHSTILFLSNTPEGTNVTFTVQPWNTQMYASEDGLFYSFEESVFEQSQYPNRLTKADVANRVKMIYYYGYNTIPEDIKRLTILLAKRQLVQDNISKSMIAGRNEFRPEMFNADLMEIESIVNDYIVLPMGNT